MAMRLTSQEPGHGLPDLAGRGWKPPGAEGAPDSAFRSTSGSLPMSATRPGPAANRPGVVSGEARDIRWSTEVDPHVVDAARTRTVLTFRIHRHDAAGTWLQPVPVQLRGWRIDGALNEGDWVEATAVWQPGLTLELTGLRNLTNGGAVVCSRGHRTPTWLWLLLALLGLIVLAIFVIAVVLIANPPAPPFELPGGALRPSVQSAP